MKTPFLPAFFALCFITTIANAQTPFTTMDSIAVNNIHAMSLVHGDMWLNTNPAESAGATFSDVHLDTPRTITLESSGALWLSGYDGSGHLHLAAQTYRDEGVGYWPGPLDPTGTLTYTTSQNWAKIWKVSQTDIQYFRGIGIHTTGNTPQSILTWPAKGNAYAQGNGGVPLTVTVDMAPFVDLNGNGIYEPLSGEYPDIKGDEALWWIFSDNGPTHLVPGCIPLGVEIHAMAYAYKRGTLIDNVVYYEYNIVNKSPNTYSDFRIAQWSDPSLGYSLDDFIGFDSVWRMGICYKGTDDVGGAGTPVNSYLWPNPPMAAITMIVLPGDVGTSYVPAGSFTYYNNDFSNVGNPVSDTEYNNYMRSKLRDGEHFSDDFVGPGTQSRGFGSGPNCNYVFPGDPADPTQWSECASNNNPGDRRSLLSSNDFTLNAGQTQKVVFALIVADTLAGGCPQASFAGIRIVADTAWADYYNPPAPSAVKAIAASNSITIYPNPAHDKLYIENTGYYTGQETTTIYNAIGQAVDVPITKTGQKLEADVSMLPNGLYLVLYRAGDRQTTAKFLKE